MPFKLSINKENEPNWHRELTFDKDEITIGRDIQSDVQLEGTKSVVSRRHAQIKRQGDSYTVTDLNSRNFTYLNSEKLTPAVDFALSEGDVMRICDFEITFNAVEHVATRYAEQTILARPNPFLQDAVQLSTLIKQLCTRFDQETGDRKGDSLQDAFRDLIGAMSDHPVLEILGSSLGAAPPFKAPATDQVEAAEVSQPVTAQEKGLLDFLLEFFVKMSQARRQFRMEFIGETMIKSSKAFSIYNCTADELKQYLFDPATPPEEQGKRFAQLKSLASELMYHQISLLDGYRASVSAGSKQIMDRFDPETVKKQVSGKTVSLGRAKISLSNFPLFQALKLVRAYADAHRELAHEDQSIIEKKYFRPGYVKRYHHTMDTALQKESDPKD